MTKMNYVDTNRIWEILNYYFIDLRVSFRSPSDTTEDGIEMNNQQRTK